MMHTNGHILMYIMYSQVDKAEQEKIRERRKLDRAFNKVHTVYFKRDIALRITTVHI